LIATNVVIGIEGVAPALSSKRRTSPRRLPRRSLAPPVEAQHGALLA
jgi:hypothetical protein